VLSIFVSHSRHDQKSADEIAAAAARVGVEAIFLDFDPDTGAGAGAEWEKRLHDRLRGCRAVILALTPSWLASPWCRIVLAQARALGKTMLPVACAPLGEQVLPEFQAGDLIKWGTGPTRLEERLRPLALEFTQSFKLDRSRPPYPGLHAFEAADAAVYFGRDAEIRAVIERLDGHRIQGEPRLVVVTGLPGVGKSSLLKAGILPQLARRPQDWRLLPVIRPQEAPETLAKVADDSAATLLLPIDQLEDIVTLASAAERAAFVRALASALGGAHPMMVLATGRSDLLAGLLDASELAPLTETWPLSPMPLDRIPRIIEGPAAVAGIGLERGLAEAIRRDLQAPPALPLLAHTLRLLHERAGEAWKLGLDDYHSLGDPALALNPIENSVRLAADQAVRALKPSEAELAALRDAFVSRLVRRERGENLPQPARERDLPADSLRLVRALTEARLLSARPSAANGEDGSIEIAHEALLAAWPLVAQWLAEEKEFLSDRERIARAHAAWSAAADHQKPHALLGGILLARARDWLAQYPQRFGAEMTELKAFIVESAKKVDADEARLAAQEARARRSERRVVALALVLAFLFLGITAFSGWQYVLARQRETVARQAEFAAAQAEMAATQAAAASKEAQAQAVAERERAAAREARAVEEQARALVQRQRSLAAVAATEQLRGNLDRALRFAVLAARGSREERDAAPEQAARTALAAALFQADWSLVLSTHEDQVASAAFSPDGKRIVTASADATARIFDAMTGEEIMLLRGHGDFVNSAAFSPDGTRIVTASADKTARIWDTATGKEITILRGHDNWVIAAAFSPERRRVVTASADGTARIWDAAAAKETALLRGHDGYVTAAAFSPDGRRIVTASADKTARIWDATSGRQIDFLRHQDAVWSAGFSPDGARIVTASADAVAHVWNAATGRELAQLRGHEDRVQSAVFSPDGKRILTASNDRTARIFDAATGKELAVLRGHEGSVRSAGFSPDGKRVVTASNDRTARVRETVANRELATLRAHEGSVNAAVYGPGGNRIVTASDDGTARIFESASGREIMALRGHDSAVRAAAFSPDGKRVVTASRDRTARIFDAENGSEPLVLRGHEGALNFAAFSPDGKRVVTASDDNTARIFDAAAGKEILALRGHEAAVNSAAFSPDGSRIVTASADRTARIFDAATGEETLTLIGHESFVQSAAFSPDGRRIVTASADRTARVWDAATGSMLAVLRGHELIVTAAAFSPDGTRIVTASADKSARIFDAASGRELAQLRGHDGIVNSAAFGPDGMRILTASADRTARVWDAAFAAMSAKALVAAACERPLHGLASLTRDEMRIAGYPDETPELDVCAPPSP
jgi:WD40 repeat protein